jgi:hypothetical protein
MKKDPKGEVVFTAKGGAWFMIVVCAIVLVSVGWIIVGAITGCVEIIGVEVLFWEVLFYLLMISSFVYVGCLLLHSINMLKAKITIGPDGLVLDGAIDRTKRLWNPFHRNYIKSDLVVELPWRDIQHIEFAGPESVVGNWALAVIPLNSRVLIEITEHQRYVMNLSLFDMRVSKEIDKYRYKHNLL